MANYKWHYANYQHPALVAAFDMSSRTPGGLMKNLVQRTGATFDATINGALTLANPLIKCKKTKCMDLDGATNWLALANPISGLSSCTIVCWINMDVNGGITWSRAGAAGNYVYIVSTFFRHASTLGFNDTRVIPVISRTYMVTTVLNAGISSIYIDAKYSERYSITPNIGPNAVDASAFIGQYFDASLKLNGRLDNMLFYNVALTPEQIWSIYRSANPRA